jgi:hypothetical protein
MASEEEQYQDWYHDHEQRVLSDPNLGYNVYDVLSEQDYLRSEGVPEHRVAEHGAVMVDLAFRVQELALEPPMESEI